MRKFIRKKGLSFLIFLMILMLLLGGISLYHLFQEIPISAMENTFLSDSGENGQDGDAQKAFTEGDGGSAEKSSGGRLQRKCRRIYQKHANLLVLVNKKQALSEEYAPELISISGGRLQVSVLLHSALEDMLADAGAVGHQYWIASAYRSRERQQQLVDEDIRALMQKGMDYQQALQETLKETQPAGHSEHETGLALDILCSRNPCMNLTQEQEPGNLWLRENCWKYGFILRYPREKEDITEIRYEPWHFRYVGKRAARVMYRHNLTLEEFCMQIE